MDRSRRTKGLAPFQISFKLQYRNPLPRLSVAVGPCAPVPAWSYPRNFLRDIVSATLGALLQRYCAQLQHPVRYDKITYIFNYFCADV
jgi:hypothetical protein